MERGDPTWKERNILIFENKGNKRKESGFSSKKKIEFLGG